MPGTLQEYYDDCVAACLDGRFPSAIPNDEGGVLCLYRGVNGKACAIGIRIPDDLYKEEMEGRQASLLPEQVLEAVLVEGMKEEDLIKLQSCHDSCTFSNLRGDEFAFNFVRKINELSCFQDVKKITPEEIYQRYHERNLSGVSS